jgi:hypothetical protein
MTIAANGSGGLAGSVGDEPDQDKGDADYAERSLALPRALWFGVLQWGVVLFAAGGDAANFYVPLATAAIGMPPEALYPTIVALTIAAVATMYAVGVSARHRSALGKSIVRGAGLWTLTVFWAALGGAAFVLRAYGKEDAGAGAVIGFDGASPPAGGLDHTALRLSIMMLALYLATGALAAWFAYHNHNPFYAATKRARKSIDKVNRGLAVLRVAEQRHTEQLNLLEAEVGREIQRRVEDLAICAALALRLKETARAELAIRLRDPATTSALTSTDLPRPRAAPPSDVGARPTAASS